MLKVQEKPTLLRARFEGNQRWSETCLSVDSAKSDQGEAGDGGGGESRVVTAPAVTVALASCQGLFLLVGLHLLCLAKDSSLPNVYFHPGTSSST